MKLRPYSSFIDHGVPWKVSILKKFGFRCFGPYHNGRWYVFYGKRAEARRIWRNTQ